MFVIEYRHLGWVWNTDNDSRYESVNIRSEEPAIVVSSEKGKIILTVDSVMGQVSTKINVECLGNKFNLEIKSGEKINVIEVISDFIKGLTEEEKKEIHNEIKTEAKQMGGIILLAKIKSEKEFDFIYTIEGISNRKKRLDLGCEYSLNRHDFYYGPIKLEKFGFIKYKEEVGVIKWLRMDKGYGFIKDRFRYTEGFNHRRAVAKRWILESKQKYIDYARDIADHKSINIGEIILLIDAYIATGANPSWFADAWEANLANLESGAASESLFKTAVTGLCRSLESSNPLHKKHWKKLSILIRDRNNLKAAPDRENLFFHKSELLFSVKVEHIGKEIVYFNIGKGRKGPKALKISNREVELHTERFTGEIDLTLD